MLRAAFTLSCLVALVFLIGWDVPATTNASPDVQATVSPSPLAAVEVTLATPQADTPTLFAPRITPVVLPASDAPALPTALDDDDDGLFAAENSSALDSALIDTAPTAVPSRVELAHAQLEAQGQHFSLIMVSPASQSLELAIYRDLRARRYRSTAGPDEGFDTHGQPCFPNCVYIPFQEVNVLAVSTWVRVLRHEIRHMNQAAHNPTLARDFREPNGIFTSYGMFSEVCADYGINVGALYRAAYRMGALRAWLGRGRYALIGNACAGDKPSYVSVVTLYNRVRRSSRAFALLFPRYR
jgi:hypothetical protein